MKSSRIVFGQAAGASNATSPMLTRISASAIMLPWRLPAIVQKAAATTIRPSIALIGGRGQELGTTKGTSIRAMPQAAAISAV